MKPLEHPEFKPMIPEILTRIAREILQAGGCSYLVGGWVRDTLIGKECRDYDIEVYRISENILLKILSRYGRPNLVGKAFGVIILHTKGYAFDFSFPRTESKIGKGHRGFSVTTHSDISFQEAAARRDFTINAMGMELPSLKLCDPYHGREDLQSKILRHVGPAFVEDSLRVLRGVQFASRFHLNLAEKTIALCRTLSLDDLSKERVFEEFKKWMIKPGKLSMGLKAFLEMDLLRFFPEIQLYFNSWKTLGAFLDRLSETTKETQEQERVILLFTALLSGAESKDNVVSFLERITNENELLQKIPLLWEISRKVIEYGERNNWIFDLKFIRKESLKLSGFSMIAQFIAANPKWESFKISEKYSRSLQMVSEKCGVWNQALEPLLSGKDLIACEIKPGKLFGEIIRKCLILQIEGKITDKKQALDWLYRQYGIDKDINTRFN